MDKFVKSDPVNAVLGVLRSRVQAYNRRSTWISSPSLNSSRTTLTLLVYIISEKQTNMGIALLVPQDLAVADRIPWRPFWKVRYAGYYTLQEPDRMMLAA